MKKYQIFLLLSSLIWKISYAQNLGVGTLMPHPSAKLDVSSNNSGFLVPRMTSIQRSGIVSPAAGLQVYDTNTKTLWYYNGTGWMELTVGGEAGYWSLGTGGSIFNNVCRGVEVKNAKANFAPSDSIFFGVATRDLLQNQSYTLSVYYPNGGLWFSETLLNNIGQDLNRNYQTFNKQLPNNAASGTLAGSP